MINNNAEESVDQESSDQLSELREQVRLTNAQLIQIVLCPEQFVFKIKQLNYQGTNFILNEEFRQSLIYLQQAERLLQYGASCGKTIDRLLIIYTLQNEACAYQKLWELEKSSNYMEAIIFNMNAYLESPPTVIIDSQIHNTSSVSYINLSTLVSRRLKMSFYYLQFSALSSQMEKHQVALGSAINALSMLKNLCQECFSYQKYIKKDQNSEKHKHILKELSTIKSTVQMERYDKYLLLAKKTVKKLKNKVLRNERLQQKQYERLVQFGIGQVMQASIVSMSEIDAEPCLKRQISLMNKIFKALFISITFFTIATELRLISVHSNDENTRRTSDQFKKSELYHLNSIIIAAKYLPCETNYLNHILKSYYSHYHIDITVHCQQSQQTTHQTQFESQGLLLTPRKYLKNFHDSQSPQTNINFLTKLQSMTKIQELSTDKAFPKISLLLNKKKIKSSSKNKSKGYFNHSLITRSHIKSAIKIKIHRKSCQNKKKKKSMLKPKTGEHSKSEKNKKSVEKKSKKSEQKSKRSSSKNKKKFQRSTSEKQMKSRSKEKNDKNKLRLKQEYFKKPQLKKQKRKINSSQSLSKLKLQNPLGVHSPKTLIGKNSFRPTPYIH